MYIQKKYTLIYFRENTPKEMKQGRQNLIFVEGR